MQIARPERLPDAFLTCSSAELHGLLGRPTLVHLKGRRDPPLFLTILQHGNEPVGFHAVQRILRKYQDSELPRSIWLFISNVEAAAQGERVLSHQQDFNRVWPGTQLPPCPESRIMQEVVETVTAEPLFLSIDLHNNTGRNPHYGCINRLDPEFLQLASLFGRTAVYFRQPVGVQSLAMSEHCPAITIECGKPDDQSGVDDATRFVDDCLHMHHLPDHDPVSGDLILLRTRATVKILPERDFSFDGSSSDVRFRADIDQYNFGLFTKGEVIAELGSGGELPLTATLDNGQDIGADLFHIHDGKLVASIDIIPSMATTNAFVARQDCLFYVMEPMDSM